MIEPVETKLSREEGVLVAVAGKQQDESVIEEHLDELDFLAETAKIAVKNRFFQRLEKPDTRTFVGQGKLEEIKTYCKSRDIDVVIFDDDLSPSQLRNLERELASLCRKIARNTEANVTSISGFTGT